MLYARIMKKKPIRGTGILIRYRRKEDERREKTTEGKEGIVRGGEGGRERRRDYTNALSA